MPAPADDVVLACRHVSKLYGHDVGRFLDGSGRAGRAGAAQMAAAGVVSAVIDVDLDIGRGETFVIMGLSGSGKSTLVRCLAGLIEPSGGQVLFEGRDLFRLPERELIQLRRHKMGMVFQHFALLPHLTVLGNVAFPLDVQGVPRAEREARAQEMIELVGLKGRERHFPRELSGGQQQRVGIARSLAADPELWFLDEPFSALDPMIRREMQDELQRLQSILNKTVVFITHDFDEAVRLADRIAIMKDGRLVQVGTAEELILHPASDYVRAFTRDAPRAKILTARAIMRPVAPGETGVAGMVPASSPIAGFAQQVEASDRPFAVVEDGRILGVIDRRAMMDVLVGRDLAPAAGEPSA